MYGGIHLQNFFAGCVREGAVETRTVTMGVASACRQSPQKGDSRKKQPAKFVENPYVLFIFLCYNVEEQSKKWKMKEKTGGGI